MSVGGGFLGEGGEEFEGGGVVLLVEGFVGLGTEGILRCGLRGSGGVYGACGELGVDAPGGKQECAKYISRNGDHSAAEQTQRGSFVGSCVVHCWYSPPTLKSLIQKL